MVSETEGPGVIATEIRLNLGSRGTRIPGFLGLDCDQHEGVDIVGAIDDLGRFDTGSVHEIYASHCLEHLPHTKTLDCLKEWARVLKPGGVLYVAVPDFARTVDIYLKAEQGCLSEWIVNFLWGDQGYATAFHYTGFDFYRLNKLLLEAGFSEASQVENFPISPKDDCSTKVSNFDGKSVSLNVVAIR